ncbi:MAG TPA: type II secretion system F family protein [Lachnospiraceae bacterium]|nr:type II secretion system F family protein [Lachnospiraceae bacterium]
MATSYRYRAQNTDGRIIPGEMKANDEAELQSKLKEEGLLLVEAKEATRAKSVHKRLKYDRVADFSRNLSKLLGAGVTLVKALRIISEDESIGENERKIYADVLKQVRSGMTLSDAMEEQGGTFPALFINMIRSSESGGNMDGTAANMAEYYSKEYKLQQKIKSSTTYPKILAVLIVIVVIIIMGFVLPQFDSLFSQMDELPPATEILMSISDFVANRWYLIIFFGVILFIIVKILVSIPQIKLLLDKLEIHVPKIGKLRKIIYTARFSRTLASMYSAGIPIVTCLQIAKTTIGNTYIESQFDQMIADIRAGKPLSDGIAGIDGFVKKLPSSVAVGEETGSLDSMLVSIADQMDYDSEIAIEQLVAMVEPIMIVIMAAIVGFIMIAVIQPIYGSYQAIADQGK